MLFASLLLSAVLSAEVISEVARPPVPDGLSGLARLDDEHYLSIDDSGGRLFSVRMTFAHPSGEITSLAITNAAVLSGVADGEGVAYDPLRRTVWVADEKGPRIGEYDCKTGRRLSTVKLPPHFAHARIGRGVESLAISSDGRTLWTATEEAVDGDGGKATATSGSVVRLQRFARSGASAPWCASGQFAYVVDPIGGTPFAKSARSGLSDLCVLPSGELIALEREFSVKGLLPSFRMRLYRVDIRKAQDVSAIKQLSGQRFTVAEKHLLLEADTGLSMYEGICVGPRLPTGEQTLLLISDGDDAAVETVMNVLLKSK